MIYFGDGMTDVPIMILVKNNGGTSIAVYKEGNEEKVSSLLRDGRVNFICRADYSENRELEKIIKLIIDSISIQSKLLENSEKKAKTNV